MLLSGQIGLEKAHAIVPPLGPVQRELLSYAGWESDRYTELLPGTAALPRNGVYTNLTGGDFPFLPHPAIVAPFETMAERVPRSVFAGQRIFLSRVDARKRVMVNEAALASRLEQEGYAIVAPGTLNGLEQIALFRDATLIVGQHGAAFTNLLFSLRGEDGPIVVELHQENYPASAFAKLCQAKRLRYTAIFSRMIDPGADGRHDSTWEADISLILETLAQLAPVGRR